MANPADRTIGEWKEWLENPSTIAFRKLLVERGNDELKFFLSLTESQDICKEFFHQKGFINGINEAVDLMQSLKE